METVGQLTMGNAIENRQSRTMCARVHCTGLYSSDENRFDLSLVTARRNSVVVATFPVLYRSSIAINYYPKY